MRRLFLVAFVFGGGAHALFAQGDFSPQIHGYLTQSFMYSGSNNYLGMNTAAGSAGWTEGAVNVNEQLTEKLRVGVQVHVTKLGEFGGWTPVFDWALLDYRMNQWVGVRAGKVKIRWGLYNDTQDADPSYLWSLLPEPLYAVDYRATDLAQNGVEVYGRLRPGDRLGEFAYSLYYGYYRYAKNDGYLEDFRETGINFSRRPGGVSPGFDLRWRTPFKGLTVGGSLMLYTARGDLPDGAYREPLTYWPTYYVKYERKKLFLSGQYMRLVQYTDTATTSQGQVSDVADTRGWFAMAGYHVTDKLQAGVYYTRYGVAASDMSDPANYFRDSVVSGRYDLNFTFISSSKGTASTETVWAFMAITTPTG